MQMEMAAVLAAILVIESAWEIFLRMCVDWLV